MEVDCSKTKFALYGGFGYDQTGGEGVFSFTLELIMRIKRGMYLNDMFSAKIQYVLKIRKSPFSTVLTYSVLTTMTAALQLDKVRY